LHKLTQIQKATLGIYLVVDRQKEQKSDR